MLKNGYIALHRRITEWGWYHKPVTRGLFIHLILTANYEDYVYNDVLIKRGQRVASLETLAEETAYSVKEIRTAINHLEMTGEITREKHTRFTIFTITNYNSYQKNGAG